jgi:dTMP kinase
VYQGISKGLGIAYVRQLHLMTLGNFMPDITFIMDIAPEIGLKRAASRAGDETRFESMDISFHQQVRKGFLELAKADASRCIVIDAQEAPDTVHENIRSALKKHLQ